MIFEIKSDLPLSVQQEIDRIELIASGQRSATEANYLVSLAPYLTNEVISRDPEDLIVLASGNTVPTSYAGFSKGALFIKKDAAGAGLYNNTGDENSATWALITDTDTDVNLVASGTPVNGVAASKLLTVSNTPAEGDTVSMGGVVYKYRVAIGAGVKAAKVLTFTGLALNTETVVLGTRTLTYKTALTEAAAVGVLTLSGNMSDADIVTIGSRSYKFTVNLSAPAVADEVKIGATASDSIDNLIAAINGEAGAGSTYSTGTVAHANVTAAVGAGDTMGVTAKVKGTAGNSITTTEVGGTSSWGAATLASGANAVVDEILIGVSAEACIDNLVAAMTHAAGEGTTYSTGTVAHAVLDCTKSAADTFTATDKVIGFAGNSIAINETLTNASWAGGATALSGGVDAESANDVLIGANAEAAIDNLVLAVTAGATEGVNYGTGTVVNPLVTAVKASASTMTCTNLVKGTVGNATVIAETGTDIAWASGAVALSGGVNGTVGSAGQLYRDSSYLYLAIAANTTADANWRRISVGSAY